LSPGTQPLFRRKSDTYSAGGLAADLVHDARTSYFSARCAGSAVF
jgi:hypothetical protein